MTFIWISDTNANSRHFKSTFHFYIQKMLRSRINDFVYVYYVSNTRQDQQDKCIDTSEIDTAKALIIFQDEY